MADVCLHLRVELGEGGEVVVLHKHAGGLVHEGYVGTEVYAAVLSLAERQAAVADVVLVGAGGGVEARMGVVGHGEDAVDGYIRRQQVVELEDQLVAVDGPLGIEVGVEVAGVHAGVRASAANDGYGGAQQRGEGILEGQLHSGQPRLRLPAVVTRSVIGQMDEITSHKQDAKIRKRNDMAKCQNIILCFALYYSTLAFIGFAPLLPPYCSPFSCLLVTYTLTITRIRCAYNRINNNVDKTI